MNMPIEYYELVRRKVHFGQIATAAIWGCALCGSAISGMGGPGNGEVCIPCGDKILSRTVTMTEVKEP
jgi:hypothetical protein